MPAAVHVHLQLRIVGDDGTVFTDSEILGGAGHFLLIRALQMAPVAVTQPFTYTLLLWTVITGYLLFGDLPDQWTVIGSAIVIAAGSYSALQDRQSRHPSTAIKMTLHRQTGPSGKFSEAPCSNKAQPERVYCAR
jgi:hypothetical protein